MFLMSKVPPVNLCIGPQRGLTGTHQGLRSVASCPASQGSVSRIVGVGGSGQLTGLKVERVFFVLGL